MTAETDIAAIADAGENTALDVRTALTSVLGRADTAGGFPAPSGTDDTDDLNTYFASSGRDKPLGSGIYLVRAGELLIPSNRRVWGQGMGATTIRLIADDYSGMPNGSVIRNENYVSGGGAGQDENITIEHLTVDGNQANLTGSASLMEGIDFEGVDEGVVHHVEIMNTDQDGIDFDSCRDSEIRRCYIHDCLHNGVHAAPGNERIKVLYNRVEDCASQRTDSSRGGIQCTNEGALVLGNRVARCRTGIRVRGTGQSTRMSVIGNMVRDTTNNDPDMFIGRIDVVVVGNVFLTEGATSDRLVVVGSCAVMGNVWRMWNGKAISVQGDSATILGNSFTLNSAGTIGVDVTAGVEDTIIASNTFGGTGADDPIVDNGTRTQISGNAGYVTEAKGSDTIVDTASSESVTHGLAVTPSSVVVTPRANEVIWVSARDATTFTVNRAGTSGALEFDWQAEG